MVKLRHRRPAEQTSLSVPGEIVPDESQFRDIEPRVRLALRQYAVGIPDAEIAEALALPDPEIIKRWAKAHAAYLDFLITSAVDPAEIFLPMKRKAALAYHEALDRGDAQTKTAAATRAFEWLIGKPVVRQVTDVRARVQVQFIDRAEPE